LWKICIPTRQRPGCPAGGCKNGTINLLPDIPNADRVIRSISTFNKKTIRKDFELLADINYPVNTILADPRGTTAKF